MPGKKTYIFRSVGSSSCADVRAVRLIAQASAALIILALGITGKVYLPPPADLAGLVLAGGVSLVLGVVLLIRLASAGAGGTLTISPSGIKKSGREARTLAAEAIDRIRDEGVVHDTHHPASPRCRRWRVLTARGRDWLLDDSLWEPTINTQTLCYRPEGQVEARTSLTVGDALLYCGLSERS